MIGKDIFSSSKTSYPLFPEKKISNLKLENCYHLLKIDVINHHFMLTKYVS